MTPSCKSPIILTKMYDTTITIALINIRNTEIEIALLTDLGSCLGLIEVLSTNQNAEIVACILLATKQNKINCFSCNSSK